jgi:hypothetical protein
MRHTRLLIIPFVMLFILACGLSNGIRQIQQAATNLPDLLTSAPTAFGAIETAVASVEPASNCPSTPTAGGLGVGLNTTKSVMQMTGQFTFTDGSVNGQPASTATLAAAAAGSFSAISSGFSAQYIGDPCNLSEIKVTIPRTDQQDTIDQGIGVMTVLFTGILQADTQLGLVTWIYQNYGTIPVGGQQQTTFGTIQFTLQRDQSNMVLDVLPAK